MEPTTEEQFIPLPTGNLNEPNEQYEKAIAQMRIWLSQIYPSSQVDRAIHVEKAYSPDGTEEELRIRARIWTFNNEYTISAHVSKERTYLGCIANSRKPRTGETWTRGRDLPDGWFNDGVWKQILVAIVRYEAEEVKSEKWKDRKSALNPL